MNDPNSLLSSATEFALTAGMLFMGLGFSAAILGAIVFALVLTVQAIAAAVKALRNWKRK